MNTECGAIVKIPPRQSWLRLLLSKQAKRLQAERDQILADLAKERKSYVDNDSEIRDLVRNAEGATKETFALARTAAMLREHPDEFTDREMKDLMWALAMLGTAEFDIRVARAKIAKYGRITIDDGIVEHRP